MILGYGGRNCWSFEDWMNIDMTLNKSVDKQYAIEGTNIIPILSFSGGNASGKSVALRVLSFLMYFCTESFGLKPDSKIPYDTFFNNDKQSDFYLNFQINEDKYLYELAIIDNKVVSEKLFLTNNRKKTLFSRKNNVVMTNLLFKNSNFLLRDNASFFSTGFQYGLKELEQFYYFFKKFKSNVYVYGTNPINTDDSVAAFYYNNKRIKDMVVKELKRYDTGIEDVKILKLKDQNNNDIFYSEFYHTKEGSKGVLNIKNQSTGTRMLYNLLCDIFLTIENGGVLLIDELDDYLHPDITPHIVEYFTSTQNTKAQLIFSTHNMSLLDFTKKYRSYLFSKFDGASICYRIDELPKNIDIRNDRSLTQAYFNGILGGRPDVKA